MRIVNLKGDNLQIFAKITMCLVLTVLFITACGPQAVEQPPLDKVTVQLKWVHQAQFAGFYVAREQGFYAEENLDVTFVPGGVGIDIFQGLINGEVDFSVVGADSLMVKRSEGVPLIAIATTYRINPFVLVAFADSGIRSPRDFIGRTVSLASGSADTQFRAMIKNLDLDIEQINVVPYTYDDTPFLDDEIDVVNSFVAGSLIPLEATIGDRVINLIWPGDYGVHFYSDTIITRDNLVTEQPDLVLRFLRATLKGHRFAVENPVAAVDASMVYADNPDVTVQESMLKASIPLIHTGKDQIGWMRADVWEEMYQMLLDQGILNQPVDLDTVYTMQFLEQVYE
jgi:NitT/TauT family transport system substrate-binding protein